MTPWLIVSLVSLAVSAVVGWLIPAWVMARLLPALESGGKRVTNFRGRSIPTGLGVVWIVWAAAVAVTGAVASLVMSGFFVSPSASDGPWLLAALGSPVIVMVAVLPALLVAGTAAFGMVDDIYGDSSAKGFRGHLAALASGRLTTGGLKLLGIGVLSVAASVQIAVREFNGSVDGTTYASGRAVATAVLATLVIALTANLVNLTDLRPGRALKSYAVLATIGVGLVTWSTWSAMGTGEFAGLGGVSALVVRVVWIGSAKLALLALVLGPVVAVWRHDLGERAMLGDAGANAMGALAGFLLAWGSPLWLLVVLVVLLVTLNAASERVSFSEVIERVAVLRWLDGLGRLPSDDPEGMKAPPPASGVGTRDIHDDE